MEHIENTVDVLRRRFGHSIVNRAVLLQDERPRSWAQAICLSEFKPDGKLTPLSSIWEDGRHFEVDRVLNVRPAASLKAGGAGIRYTCRILDRQTYLFYEEDRWFVSRDFLNLAFDRSIQLPYLAEYHLHKHLLHTAGKIACIKSKGK